MSVPFELSVQETAQRISGGGKLHLIDVREPYEFATARMEGAELIPMRSVPGELQHIEGLAEQAPVVVICHHGVRSLQVVNWLRQQGVERCQSMSGGMDAWSMYIDPTVPRY